MHPDDGALLALVDGELRGDALSAVDAHLDTCDSCRELVGMLASGTRRRDESASVRSDRIGRFLLIEELGRGAMGVVYAGYDPELDRRVAIKVLYGEADTSMGRARLVREAQAMARITHPRVVAVFDVGTRGDDVYVAMELVEGTHLRAWMASEPPREDRLRAFREAGMGLAALHDAGLVHRDFKPENVLIGEGGAKVTDFGLARGEAKAGEVPNDADIVSATLTRTGAVLGTPAYMAPEQLEGGEVGPKADQFAYCVALWEALYGQRPHHARTFAELRVALQAPPPEALGDKRIGAALRRGLDPDPARRHPDMRSLLDALAPPAERPWKAALATGLVLSAALGLTLMLRDSPSEACAEAPPLVALDAGFQIPSGPATPDVPEGVRATLARWAERWGDARTDACDATHERHAQSGALLDRRLACLDRQRMAHDGVVQELQRGGPNAVQALDALPEPNACAADRLMDSLAPPAVAREALAAVAADIDQGRVALAVARWDDATQHAARALESAAASGWRPAIAEARRLRADLLRARGDYDAAYAEGRLGLLEARRADADAEQAQAWIGLVRSRAAAGRFTEAAQDAEDADAALVGAGDEEEARQALLHVRGVVRTNLGDEHGAESDLRAALDGAERRFGQEDARLAPLYTSLGELHRRRGELEDALDSHRAALRLNQNTFGEAHPRVARDLHNVAGILRRMGRLEEAETHYRQALAASEQSGGDAAQRGLTHNSLGLVASERGDTDAARSHYATAVEILEEAGHNDASIALSNLALLDLEDGAPAAARDRLERAIEMDTARLGARSERVFHLLTSLGAAQIALGALPAARAALTRALETARERGEPDDIAAAEEHLAALPAVEETRPAPRPAARSRPAGSQSARSQSAGSRPAPPPTEPAAEETPTPPASSSRTGGLTYGAAQAVE
ncbi:MAG: tetratricopeptide repeat protein [Sandaracinaceae bacterium]